MPSKYNHEIIIGKSIDGKPIRKKFGAPTKRELKKKIEDYKKKVAIGYLDTYNITLESWSKEWLETFKLSSDKLSESTKYGYGLCVKHIIDYFGPKAMLQNVKVIDLQNFFNSKSDLSESMCNKLKVTCKSIFKKACANGIIHINPCEGVEFPNGVKAEERKSYSIEEYKKVLEFAKQHPYGIGVYVILSTGMRRGEAMGFIPETDINNKKRLVYMRRTVTDINGLVQLKSGGKSRSAERAIPVSKEFIEFFSKNKVSGLLFKNSKGGIRSPKSWARNDYKRFCQDLYKAYPDIPTLTPHELRHTYGTMLYKAGTDIYTLQKIMGHSSVDVTTKIYLHDDEDDLLNNVRFV